MEVMIVFMVLLVFGKFLIHNRNISGWILFVVISAIGFFIMPNMIFPFGIIIIWMFFEVVSGDEMIRIRLLLKDLTIAVICVIILTFLLYLPVLTVTGYNNIQGPLLFQEPSNIIRLPSLDYFIMLFQSLKFNWIYWNMQITFFITLLLITGFFFSIFFHRKISCYRVPIIISVPILLSLVIVAQWFVLKNNVFSIRRGWLFLLPLYLGVSSAGLTYVGKLIKLKKAKHRALLLNLFPLFIALILSFNVIRSQSVYYSNEAGALRDVEEVSLFMKDHLKNGDSVVAFCPSNYPLLYYFDQYNISTDFIEFSPINSAQRVFIVVNERWFDGDAKDTLTSILKKINRELKKANFSSPQLLKQFNFSKIYGIVRI